MGEQKDLYESVSEAAAAIGVSEKTIHEWLKSGRLKGKRDGGRREGGKVNWLINHTDLVAARRGTMFDEQENAPQLRLDTEAGALAPLGLQVVWPTDRRYEPFKPGLLAGYSRLRVVTYSVSIPMILKLLSEHDYEDAEVLFGDERLAKATDIASLMVLHHKIEEQLTKSFVGMGGVGDPKTRAIMDRQADRQVRFLAMSGSVVHTKLYLLESNTSRRVLVGSANLSTVAFSGKQGEVLLAFDDDDWMWGVMSNLYDALRAQATISLKVASEVKDANLVAAEDLPVFRHVKATEEPVTLYVGVPSDVPGSADLMAVGEDQLLAVWGPSLRDHLKPAPTGEVVVTPAVLHKIKRDVSASKPVRQEMHHHLARLDGRFLYNYTPIERPSDEGDAEKVWQDADLITRYINNYRDFGQGAEILQRNYFAVMGWLYFSPFMSQLRRERSKLGPGNFDCKAVALIYGPSNCGKTDMVTFLFESMFGHAPPPMGDKDFTPTHVLDKQARVGLCPIFYDDIGSQRFTSRGRYGGEAMGESIVKAYDRLHHELPAIPCLVASLNSDARDFSNEVRKRALLVYTTTPMPADDIELAQRMEREAKQLHNRIGTSFYREYLFRMSDIVDSVSDWATFDYLGESTGVLLQLFRESLGDEEELPEWCKRISGKEYDDFAWEPKRFHIKNRLDSKRYTRYFPPKIGYWTVHGSDVVLGVEDLRGVLASKEIPDHLIHREACAGGNLHLWEVQTLAFIRRGEGDGQYKLPKPKILARLMGTRQ